MLDRAKSKARAIYKKVRKKIPFYLHLLKLRVVTFSFRSPEKNIQLYDKRIKKARVFFTTDLVQTGFSDQLFGFELLYNIGKRLGMDYAFIPLRSHRSSVPFWFWDVAEGSRAWGKNKFAKESASIFDFLGVNASLEKLSAKQLPKNYKTYKIDLSIFDLKEKNFTSFDDLTNYLKSKLVHLIQTSEATLFQLSAHPPTYFSYFKLLSESKSEDINFRKFYDDHHQKKHIKSNYDAENIKLLTHIRQGDTAVIKTPWNTYIPVWYKLPLRFTQFDKLEDIEGAEFILPSDFYHFLNHILTEIKEDISTQVFSDGYKKAFLQVYSKSKKSQLSENEIYRLKEAEKEYEKNQFKSFDHLPNTEKFIGEEPDKLFMLINAFFDADILVVGTQQMMIPKLVATYRKEDMPLLLVLHKGQKMCSDYLGLDSNHEYIIQIDLNNVDKLQITDKIKKFILAKKESNKG